MPLSFLFLILVGFVCYRVLSRFCGRASAGAQAVRGIIWACCIFAGVASVTVVVCLIVLAQRGGEAALGGPFLLVIALVTVPLFLFSYAVIRSFNRTASALKDERRVQAGLRKKND